MDHIGSCGTEPLIRKEPPPFYREELECAPPGSATEQPLSLLRPEAVASGDLGQSNLGKTGMNLGESRLAVRVRLTQLTNEVRPKELMALFATTSRLRAPER